MAMVYVYVVLTVCYAYVNIIIGGGWVKGH